jgi:hypothetical protein
MTVPSGLSIPRGGPVHDHGNLTAYLLQSFHEKRNHMRLRRARARAPRTSPHAVLTVTTRRLVTALTPAKSRHWVVLREISLGRAQIAPFGTGRASCGVARTRSRGGAAPQALEFLPVTKGITARSASGARRDGLRVRAATVEAGSPSCRAPEATVAARPAPNPALGVAARGQRCPANSTPGPILITARSAEHFYRRMVALPTRGQPKTQPERGSGPRLARSRMRRTGRPSKPKSGTGWPPRLSARLASLPDACWTAWRPTDRPMIFVPRRSSR